MVAKQRDDCVARTHVLSHPNGARNIDPRRAAHHQPLELQQVKDRQHHLFIRDPIGAIHGESFQVRGDAALADTLTD